MTMRTARRCCVGVALLGIAVAGTAGAQFQNPPPTMPSAGYAAPEPPSRNGDRGAGAEGHAGRWSAGGGVGFLSSTPDGNAVGVNGNLDYFVDEHASVGPLVQMGLTNDMTLVGVSGQGKYWIPVSGTNGRGRVALQSGVGIAHADFRHDDTSWLVPVGVSYDYALDGGPSLTATALVNFTNLHTGSGSGADVMPGVVFGARF